MTRAMVMRPLRKPDPLAGTDFSNSCKQLNAGAVIAPRWRNWIEQATTLPMPQMVADRDVTARAPDRWFHPSSHPMWPARALYEYLAHPEGLMREELSYESRLSVTFGSWWGEFSAGILRAAGVLLPAKPCTHCPAQAKCHETRFVDELTGSAGHVDGEVNPELTGGQDVLWEGKTTQENTWAGFKRLKEMDDLDNAAFIETWPGWFRQAIEYQRISGRRKTIFTVAVLGFPWLVREFHVDWNPEVAEETAAKYRRARQAHADQRPPHCMCTTKQARDCEARKLCAQ